MAAAGMGVEGGDQLVATLNAAARALAGLNPTEAGRLLADQVARTAPRDTGYMASRVESIVAAGHADVIVATDYAVYVNARTHWATRALDQTADQLVDAVAADVATIVDQIQGD